MQRARPHVGQGRAAMPTSAFTMACMHHVL